jgi:hypothetical protein
MDAVAQVSSARSSSADSAASGSIDVGTIRNDETLGATPQCGVSGLCDAGGEQEKTGGTDRSGEEGNDALACGVVATGASLRLPAELDTGSDGGTEARGAGAGGVHARASQVAKPAPIE